ncbi:MAG: hypothetical protein WCH43_00125 [Verrucomicrobiota bacterium]
MLPPEFQHAINLVWLDVERDIVKDGELDEFFLAKGADRALQADGIGFIAGCHSSPRNRPLHL